jgi:hypothetical protein
MWERRQAAQHRHLAASPGDRPERRAGAPSDHLQFFDDHAGIWIDRRRGDRRFSQRQERERHRQGAGGAKYPFCDRALDSHRPDLPQDRGWTKTREIFLAGRHVSFGVSGRRLLEEIR